MYLESEMHWLTAADVAFNTTAAVAEVAWRGADHLPITATTFVTTVVDWASWTKLTSGGIRAGQDESSRGAGENETNLLVENIVFFGGIVGFVVLEFELKKEI